jgi:hypothetical protein
MLLLLKRIKSIIFCGGKAAVFPSTALIILNSEAILRKGRLYATRRTAVGKIRKDLVNLPLHHQACAGKLEGAQHFFSVEHGKLRIDLICHEIFFGLSSLPFGRTIAA